MTHPFFDFIKKKVLIKVNYGSTCVELVGSIIEFREKEGFIFFSEKKNVWLNINHIVSIEEK